MIYFLSKQFPGVFVISISCLKSSSTQHDVDFVNYGRYLESYRRWSRVRLRECLPCDWQVATVVCPNDVQKTKMAKTIMANGRLENSSKQTNLIVALNQNYFTIVIHIPDQYKSKVVKSKKDGFDHCGFYADDTALFCSIGIKCDRYWKAAHSSSIDFKVSMLWRDQPALCSVLCKPLPRWDEARKTHKDDISTLVK